jgi:hypothetical protein
MDKFWVGLKELALPVVGGAIYGAVVGYAKQLPLDGVTAGGVAFFCLLAVQGRLLRGATKILSAPQPDQPVVAADMETSVAADDDFVSIRSGIEELKEQGALPEVAPEKPEEGQKALFRNLVRSAPKRSPVEALAPKQLLDLKMPYQAVLNAAVNFEREVRRKADLPGGRTVPLARLFEQPQFDLSKEKLQQLDTLRRVRNSILHGFETLVDPLEAAELVAAYDRAASWFGPPKSGQP